MSGLSIDRIVTSASSSFRSVGTRVTALDAWAFVLPAITFAEIQLVGRLVISEVLALALLPWLLRVRDRVHVPRWLIVLWGAWLASQVITDFVVHSAFTDWARGWAAIVFTMIDLLAVTALAGTPRRARIFALGLAAGGLVGYFINPSADAIADPWKWAFAGPTGLALAAGLSGAIWLRRPWVVVAAFAAFGWLSAVLLYRSLSGVAVLTAVYLLAGIVVYRRRGSQRPTLGRTVAGLVFYGVAAVAVFLTINLAASANLLGAAAKDKFDTQTGVKAVESGPPGGSGPSATSGPGASGTPSTAVNPFVVLLGGRAEILASPWAILDSPILGHGSWAKDPKYAQIQRTGLTDLGVVEPSLYIDPNLIPTHSYLLGSWVWAGVAGGLFWAGVIGLALWLIVSLYTVRLSISPLVAFTTTGLLWDIAFSPYGNTQRIVATFGIALILLALRMIRDLDTPPAEVAPRTIGPASVDPPPPPA